MVQTIGSIPFGTQLDWLWAELQGPEKKTWQNFLTNPNLITPQDFATAFENTYERADGKHLEKRQGFAKDVFKAYEFNKKDMLPENVTTAVDYLTNKGMTLPQATGVVGNLMAESGFELDPDAYNPSEGGIGAYGIAQWRGKRQTGLQEYFNRMQPQQTQEENNMVQQPNNLLSMLQGGLQKFIQPQDENQLFTRGQQVAMALDPLIHPNFRAGKQIAENAKSQRAFELQQGAQTRTLTVLNQLCSDGDEAACSVARSVEAKAIEPKDAMTIYYRQRFAKPTKTATQKTGAQLNAELIANGQEPIYDPKKPYNVFSTGDIKEVDGGINITNRLGENTDNDLREIALKSQNELISANAAARESLTTIEQQRDLLMQADFQSGFGQEFLLDMQKGLSRLGFEGGADLSAMEQFIGISAKQVLDSLGGSLGVGVSEQDLIFMQKMVTNIRMTKKGIRDYLRVLEAREKGKQRKYEFYKIYIAKQQKDMPQDQKTYIIDNPYKFEMEFHDWVQQQPSLFGEA